MAHGTWTVWIGVRTGAGELTAAATEPQSASAQTVSATPTGNGEYVSSSTASSTHRAQLLGQLRCAYAAQYVTLPVMCRRKIESAPSVPVITSFPDACL